MYQIEINGRLIPVTQEELDSYNKHAKARNKVYHEAQGAKYRAEERGGCGFILETILTGGISAIDANIAVETTRWRLRRTVKKEFDNLERILQSKSGQEAKNLLNEIRNRGDNDLLIDL